MNLKLILKDRKGNILNEGDIVKISDGKRFTFFSEVKYNPEKKCIYPFHTFSFHSFEKVSEVPIDALQSNQEDYKVWYTINPEEDGEAQRYSHYMRSWKECERLLEDQCFFIESI